MTKGQNIRYTVTSEGQLVIYSAFYILRYSPLHNVLLAKQHFLGHLLTWQCKQLWLGIGALLHFKRL